MKQFRFMGACVALLLASCLVSQTGYAKEMIDKKDTILSVSEIFSEDDLRDNFENFSLEESVVSFPNQRKGMEGACVVGAVKDNETEVLLKDATIYVDNREIVKTDKNGKFKILDVPSGTYNWTVTCEGYYNACYLNYDVNYEDGVTIFCFYISSKEIIEKDREEIQKGSCGLLSEHTGDVEVKNRSSRSLSAAPNVSGTVKVYYNGAIRNVNRQTYVYTVVSSELSDTSTYNTHLTSSQTSQLYTAQAVAANTFLEYYQSVSSPHASAGYKVCSTAHCQAYDPTKVISVAINATANIFYYAGNGNRTDIMMYKPTSTTYDYIYGAYFSSCGGAGTLSYTGQPALQAVSCTDLCSGYGGHRHGMCQRGAAYLAKNGYSYSNILKYYYSNSGLTSCRIN